MEAKPFLSNSNQYFEKKKLKIDFRKYIGKLVKIIDNDQKEWIGKAVSVDLAINYDDAAYDSLDLKIDGRDRIVAFPEDEIKSIQILK
ncbi:hypothetical protein CIRMBP1197_00807 [Enterococcus cecorum]|nr:hypothetical protein CIRMBP1272_00414 [Enterococcus cecorum]CAI3327337.1 hypothetical protein CIRMBP1197_00807 [Enterococcus cecorum]